MAYNTLSDLVSAYLPPLKRTSGFHPFRCPLCNDYKDRGGIKLEPGVIHYKCFNCSTTIIQHEGKKLRPQLREVLDYLGVPKEELQRVEGASLLKVFNKTPEPTLEDLKTGGNVSAPKTVKFPPDTHQVGTGHDPVAEAAITAYLTRRHVVQPATKFFYSAKYPNRVIIPFWLQGQLLFWQARGLNDTVSPRYISCQAPKDNVIYNAEELYRRSDLPLFVVEGVFDAMAVNGIAIIGSTLNTVKLEALKRSPRRLIFVLDADHNGKLLGQHALAEGWEVSVPFHASGQTGDINACIDRYGRLFTIYQLMQNITRELPLRIKLIQPPKRSGGKIDHK